MKFEQPQQPKIFTPEEQKKLNASREDFEEQAEKDATTIRECSPFYKRLTAESVDPKDVTRVYAELADKYRTAEDTEALAQLDNSDIALSKVKTSVRGTGDGDSMIKVLGKLDGKTIEGIPCNFTFELWSKSDKPISFSSLEEIMEWIREESKKSITVASKDYFTVVGIKGNLGNEKLEWTLSDSEDLPFNKAQKVLNDYFGVAADKYIEIYKLWQEKLEKIQSAIDEIKADPLSDSELYKKLKITEKLEKITEQYNKLKPYLNAAADTFDFFGNLSAICANTTEINGYISEVQKLRTLATTKKRN